MSKKTFTQAEVAAIYIELNRRIRSDLKQGVLANDAEAREWYKGMLQGVYSVLMLQADNWPQVRIWCDKEEEDWSWRFRGYED